jgi:hypothetical protein
MPQDLQMSVVEKSSTRWHTLSLVIVGALAGALLLLGAEFFLLRTSFVQGFLRSYFASIQTAALPADTTNTEVPHVPLLTTASTTIAVPKAYANQAYFDALNSVVATYNNIIATAAQLAPVMLQINTQATSGNYAGIIDLAVKAKILLAQETSYTASFAQYLTALSVANQATQDAQTKSLTDTLLDLGQRSQSDLSVYFQLLNGLLSGSVPTQEQIQKTTTQSRTVVADVSAFKDALTPLLQRFQAAANTK